MWLLIWITPRVKSWNYEFGLLSVLGDAGRLISSSNNEKKFRLRYKKRGKTINGSVGMIWGLVKLLTLKF